MYYFAKINTFYFLTIEVLPYTRHVVHSCFSVVRLNYDSAQKTIIIPLSVAGEYGKCLAQVHSWFNVFWNCSGDVAAVQAVAAEMRAIADQFEQDVVAQAAQNLSRTLQNSPFHVSVLGFFVLHRKARLTGVKR